MSLCFPLCLRSISRPTRIFLIRSTAVFIIAITFSRIVLEGRRRREKRADAILGISKSLISLLISHSTCYGGRMWFRRCVEVCDIQFTQLFVIFDEEKVYIIGWWRRPCATEHLTGMLITAPLIKWIIYVNTLSLDIYCPVPMDWKSKAACASVNDHLLFHHNKYRFDINISSLESTRQHAEVHS